MAAAASPLLESYQGRKPRAPLPPIILSNVPGTWAYDTMSRRIRDDILARIYAGAFGRAYLPICVGVRGVCRCQCRS